ncbi:MAG: glycosyltransferase family 2 protein, partial [Isosphaeraceae bacterium]
MPRPSADSQTVCGRRRRAQARPGEHGGFPAGADLQPLGTLPRRRRREGSARKGHAQSPGRTDPRIKLVHAPGNLGRARRRNAALDLGTGEFIGFLDAGDRLPPNAFFEVARALDAAPNTDLIDTDEDRLDATGTVRWNPFFKPDWSPDLLLSTNYLGHLALYRRSLVPAIGGFRPDADGSHDYDLALRFTERTERIVHLPGVLCSRRGGSELRGDDQPLLEAGRRVIAEALRRRGIAGCVEPGPAPGRWRVRYPLQGRPTVTLVIPSGGRMEHLRPCLESVLEESTYDPLRILVIDNSDGTAVGELAARSPAATRGQEAVPEGRLDGAGWALPTGRGLELVG